MDQSITDAITEFPTPATRTDLRSFFGLVNQLSASTNKISKLLSTKNDFIWSPAHNDAFKKAKDSLTVAPVLSFFDSTKPTQLRTDASCHGLGFILQQKSVDGTWNLIQAGSPGADLGFSERGGYS